MKDPFANAELPVMELEQKQGITINQAGREQDPDRLALDQIDTQALVKRMQDSAMRLPGAVSMTNPEIRAAVALIDLRISRAPQRVEVNQRVEVRDRSRELRALIDLLSRPGAVTIDADGRPQLNVASAELRDATTARADGRGEPQTIDVCPQSQDSGQTDT